MTNGAPIHQTDERDVARAFFKSGRRVQGLGVTATVIALGAFIVSHLQYFLPLEDHVREIFEVTIPVAIAYILALIVAECIPEHRYNTTQKALRWVYGLFIIPDIFLLGLLVFYTGGPSTNVFMPVFLLIPAVATCYCHPTNSSFKIMNALIIFVFLGVMFSEYWNITPNYNKVVTSKYMYIFINASTLFCLITAALCYYWTHKIRTGRCDEIRQNQQERTGVCTGLYL